MCSYLDQVGATYYFRRAVPKDLVGYFLTGSGKPRTEWKFSLGTKDREAAKRLLRPHEIETDKLIDDSRAALANQSGRAVDTVALEQAEAVAAIEAEKRE